MPLPLRKTPIDPPNPARQSSRGHHIAARGHPDDVRQGFAGAGEDRASVEQPAVPERRMLPTEAGDRRGELDQGLIGLESPCIQVSSES